MKKVKLDCYTFNRNLLELQPIVNKVHNPSWWSKLKKYYEHFDVRSGIRTPVPTVKLCPGVADYIRNPIHIKLWTDIIFRVRPDGRVTYVAPDGGARNHIDTHAKEQTGKDLYPGRATVKLANPWVVKGSDKTRFMVTENHYSEELRQHGIIVSPGIINFYDQHSLNIFLVFPLKDEEYQVELKYGTVVATLHAMTDEPVVVNNHLTTVDEYNATQNEFPSTFFGRYYAKRKVAK